MATKRMCFGLGVVCSGAAEHDRSASATRTEASSLSRASATREPASPMPNGRRSRRARSLNDCSACRSTTSTRSCHGRLANLTSTACRADAGDARRLHDRRQGAARWHAPPRSSSRAQRAATSKSLLRRSVRVSRTAPRPTHSLVRVKPGRALRAARIAGHLRNREPF